mmetsp:Transcript_15665/g.32950  ORF Transcript_15665/g.32950 Transcript_15665/m.32950 type:complete len:84 (-) Transcript_15665:1521-1772(-)
MGKPCTSQSQQSIRIHLETFDSDEFSIFLKSLSTPNTLPLALSFLQNYFPWSQCREQNPSFECFDSLSCKLSRRDELELFLDE